MRCLAVIRHARYKKTSRLDIAVRAQYYNNDSVVKPHNPYAPQSATSGFNSRLEGSALDRGLGSLTAGENGRMGSIGRTNSVKSSRCRPSLRQRLFVKELPVWLFALLLLTV